MRLEDQEQIALFEWANLMAIKYPELRLLYHIPNEGRRSAREGARLKAMGLKAGVPDLCLPVARGGFHALYIELKAPKNGRTTEHQREWLERLVSAGNYACVSRGWKNAADVIRWYLEEAKNETK